MGSTCGLPPGSTMCCRMRRLPGALPSAPFAHGVLRSSTSTLARCACARPDCVSTCRAHQSSAAHEEAAEWNWGRCQGVQQVRKCAGSIGFRLPALHLSKAAGGADCSTAKHVKGPLLDPRAARLLARLLARQEPRKALLQVRVPPARAISSRCTAAASP